MGAGIAIEFRRRFKCIEDLIKQEKNVGEVAYLKVSNLNRQTLESRYIYYLITKERYCDKPTYKSLTASLLYLRELLLKHRVKCLCIPRIG